MEDKKMTEKESLELITTMIQRTRERYVGDGKKPTILYGTGCGLPSVLSAASLPPSWTRSNG